MYYVCNELNKQTKSKMEQIVKTSYNDKEEWTEIKFNHKGSEIEIYIDKEPNYIYIYKINKVGEDLHIKINVKNLAFSVTDSAGELQEEVTHAEFIRLTNLKYSLETIGKYFKNM